MATKNVVFLIHGIGREAGDWSRDPIAELAKAAELSRAFDQVPLGEQVDFVPILYNDIFDLVLGRWNDLAADLQVSDLVLPGAIETLKDVIRDISAQGNAISEYAGDAVLYVGFRLVRNAVLLRVIQKIVQGITDAYAAYDPPPRFGIVAHSLGTTVAHDALQLLATLDWNSAASMKEDVALLRKAGPAGAQIADAIIAAGNPAKPADFRFDSVFMISNTSRLLHSTRLDPYHSCVYPAEIDFPPTPGYCTRFFVADNQFDFVGLALRAVGCAFRVHNDNWMAHGIGNSTAAKAITLENLHQPNAHDLTHYLEHPRVYSEIFRRFARTYDDAHHREALARLQPGNADYFPRFMIDPAQARVSAPWSALLQKLADKLRRGDNWGQP